MAKRQQEEKDFRGLVESKPELQQEYGSAWGVIAEAEKKSVETLKQRVYRSVSSASPLAGLALTIVQYVAEVKKPDGQRLDGFHDSELESLRFRMFSPAPVYPQMEEALLSGGLKESQEGLGADDPFVKTALDGHAPTDVAKRVITGTKLADVALRKSLVEGGEAAVASSADPLVVWVRKIEPQVRAMHKWYEDNIESVETPAGEKIGKAHFAVYGKSTYPDATFTLRLAFGTVKGYPMNGTEAPPRTTFYGLYGRAHDFSMKPPFDLPARYLDSSVKQKLDLSTPFNFVSTCDITGGNSGSPVINRDAELVGLIFDGNIESLVGDYVYY